MNFLHDKRECIVCGRKAGLEKHHVMHGYSTGFKEKSEKYGLMAWLCPKHHYELHHGRRGLGLDEMLKKTAQEEFEKSHTREEWLKEFGKNYL